MALVSGDLTHVGVPELFRAIADEQRTGRLSLSRSNGDRPQVAHIYFREGDAYHARLMGSGVKLGARLVSAGLVSSQDVEAALRTQRPSSNRRRLGAVLIEWGLVTSEQLESIIHEQIEDTIFEVLRWDGGNFSFESDTTTDEDVGIGVSVENLVMEGARRFREWHQITRRIPTLEAIPRLNDQEEGAIEVALTPEEWAFVSRMDGRRSIARLAGDCGFTDLEAARTAFGLVTAGLITIDLPPGLEMPADEVDLELQLAELERAISEAAGDRGAGRTAMKLEELSGVVTETAEPLEKEAVEQPAEEALAEVAAEEAAEQVTPLEELTEVLEAAEEVTPPEDLAEVGAAEAAEDVPLPDELAEVLEAAEEVTPPEELPEGDVLEAAEEVTPPDELAEVLEAAEEVTPPEELPEGDVLEAAEEVTPPDELAEVLEAAEEVTPPEELPEGDVLEAADQFTPQAEELAIEEGAALGEAEAGEFEAELEEALESSAQLEDAAVGLSAKLEVPEVAAPPAEMILTEEPSEGLEERALEAELEYEGRFVAAEEVAGVHESPLDSVEVQEPEIAGEEPAFLAEEPSTTEIEVPPFESVAGFEEESEGSLALEAPPQVAADELDLEPGPVAEELEPEPGLAASFELEVALGAQVEAEDLLEQIEIEEETLEGEAETFGEPETPWSSYEDFPSSDEIEVPSEDELEEVPASFQADLDLAVPEQELEVSSPQVVPQAFEEPPPESQAPAPPPIKPYSFWGAVPEEPAEPEQPQEPTPKRTRGSPEIRRTVPGPIDPMVDTTALYREFSSLGEGDEDEEPEQPPAEQPRQKRRPEERRGFFGRRKR